MISSKTMSPYTQPMSRIADVPAPWALGDLRATRVSFAAPLEPEAAAGPSDAEIASQMVAEADLAQARAFDAGYNAGRSDTVTRFEAELRTAMDALHSAAAAVHEQEERYMGALEDNLATLAVCVARQVIAREVRTSPDITADLIRRAVNEFPVTEALRIRINPFDLSTLSVEREGIAVTIAPGREIVWVPDSRVEAGGCVIEGRERILDGRVDSALERAYRRLSNTKA